MSETSFTVARGQLRDAKDVLALVDGLLALWEREKPSVRLPAPAVHLEADGPLLLVHLHWFHPTGGDLPSLGFTFEADQGVKAIRWALDRRGDEIGPGHYSIATDEGTGVVDGLAVLRRMLKGEYGNGEDE